MPTAGVSISAEETAGLGALTQSGNSPAGQVERARIVLAAAGGAGTTGAAEQVGVTRPTVIRWRDRFVAHSRAGLDDEPRSGRPKTIDDAAILTPRPWTRRRTGSG